MEFGWITLLEICEKAHGSRVACCLPRGEFLFVTPDAAYYFRAASASMLYSRNISEYLAPYDLEKLQDYVRVHGHNGIVANSVPNKITMMIRLAESGETLWVRLKTVPVSLRLLRCIDSVTVLASLKHHFADSSSFVVSDEELSRIFSLSTTSSALAFATDEGNEPNEAALAIAVPAGYNIPLELKVMSSRQCDESMLAMSPVSPDGLLDAFDESLSSLAFEADWAVESSSVCAALSCAGTQSW